MSVLRHFFGKLFSKCLMSSWIFPVLTILRQMVKRNASTVALNKFYAAIVVLAKMIGIFYCNRWHLLWIIRYMLAPVFHRLSACLGLMYKLPILLRCLSFRTTRLLLFPRFLSSVKLCKILWSNPWRSTTPICKNRPINAVVMFAFRLVTWFMYPPNISGYLLIYPRNYRLCLLALTRFCRKSVLFLIVWSSLPSFRLSTMCFTCLF